MIFMIRRKPKKISHAERFGMFRPEYGIPEFEEALSGDSDE